jgi:hypothetical protein
VNALVVVVHTTDTIGQALVLAAYILGFLAGAGCVLAGFWFHR